MRKLNLTSVSWVHYAKSDLRPSNIPANPNKIYKNKGWTNWSDFLGTNYHQFKEFYDARRFTHSLNLKTKDDWYSYWGKNNRPQDIPASPNSTYAEKGWISWADWLGNEWMPFNEAREYALSLTLKSALLGKNY